MRAAEIAGGKTGAIWLLSPTLIVFGCLLIAPLFNLVNESLRVFVSGHVGSSAGAALTLANYTDLLIPAYLIYFLDTFRIGLIATLLGLSTGYVIAFIVAREQSKRIRRLWLSLLIGMLFLSVLVRVYSIGMAFSPSGIFRYPIKLLNLNPSGSTVAEIMVIAGLLNSLIPISALMLVGTIQNVDPRLAEAAQSLGAGRMQSHLTITLPLSIRGILSTFLISYAFCLSAFVFPLILGKGRVLFVSNLIYARFGELANYPSGAAISITMLLLSLLLFYFMTRVAAQRWKVD